MYAEVIPQIRTIPDLGVFDYNVPSNINVNVGDIVEIEFKKTKKIGLVYRIKEKSKFKNVKSIISKVDNIFLSSTQVNLITWMVKRYKISPALAFKIMMPEIPKKNREIKEDIIKYNDIKIKKNRIKNIKKIINKVLKNKQTYLLHYSDVDEKNVLLMGLIKKCKQVLIIVPEKKNVFELAGIFAKQRPSLIYSGLAKNKKWHIWQNIKYNKTKVIIGTRNAIFIPPDNLDLIIIDDEENKSHYNYDQNPKYHVLEIAMRLKKKLFLTSQSPSVYCYYKFNHINLTYKQNSKVEIVDMEEEKTKKNYSYFSDQLIDAVNKYKKSLLLFNRKGEAKLLLCKNCQEILPYLETVDCPRCKSMDLKKISLGTTKLKSDLEKIFANKKVIEITKNNHSFIKTPAGRQNIKDLQNYDIIIGTEYALRVVDLDKIDFIGIISVDHQLAIPDYRASERVYQFLTKIINLNKPLIIQTHSPDNKLIRAVVKQDYKRFFDEEIKLRKEFGYNLRLT